MEKLTEKDGETPDLVLENIAGLKQLFPEVFIDGRIDFEALKETLGSYVDEREERYSFTWHGKSRARRIAQTPSTGTLLPCKEDSVNWDSTQNIFIEGDNLEVLKLLQKSYHRKVKMIYIDPPYNTGKEFIYPDKWQDNLDTYLRYTGQIDDEGFKTTTNTETSGRYHTNWLNMMYPRLKLARNLLRDDGVIFISIDDHEQASLRKLCDEIFGEESFIGCICWQKKYAPSNDTIDLSPSHDFIICYSRTSSSPERTPILNRLPRSEKMDKPYKNPDGDVRGRWRPDNYLCNKSADQRPNLYYPVVNPNTGEEIWPSRSAVWRYSKEQHERHVVENRVWWGKEGIGRVPAFKRFLSDVPGQMPTTWWSFEDVGHNDEAKKELNALVGGVAPSFDTPKPVRLLSRMLELSVATDNDIVLDFFAGSGTTAHASMKFSSENSIKARFILVQLPETIQAASAVPSIRTIADFSRARLRLAAEALEGRVQESKTDLGFKSFKLSSSNIKPWDSDFEKIDGDLFGAVENIKPERSEHDVLYELILKYGLDLAVPVDEQTVSGRTVFIIGAGALIVCLADSIDLEVVRGIAAIIGELSPEACRVVFKDSGFGSDVDKTNAVQILKQVAVNDVKSL